MSVWGLGYRVQNLEFWVEGLESGCLGCESDDAPNPQP